MKTICLAFSGIACLLSANSYSQCLTPVNFVLQKSLPTASPLLKHDMSAKRDSFPSKPYLYIAGKEQGLKIYDITTLNSPVLSGSIATASLSNLDVNSITQVGNYLYLALGDIFSSTAQNSGMAIIDVTTPSTPVIKSVYSFTATSGAGGVAVENNYAYLAAMQNGILVLDVTNKSSVVFVSQFKPNINFPKTNPNSSEIAKINARSMVVKNNIIYLCYDAGGFRILNATIKTSLKENGKYSNVLLLNRPRAFNNIILNDTLVYAAVDYCGMEVLNVKDTSNIKQIGWWNPWKCQNAANTWFNSPGHTNEIEFDPNCKMVFMSSGRSDVMAVSVNNPTLPDSCYQYGLKTDSMGTWGIGRYQNQIYVAYISTWPLYIPFHSEWSGVKILTYNNNCTAGMKELGVWGSEFGVFPNPSESELTIKNPFVTSAELVIYDTKGNLILKKDIEAGISSVKLVTGNYTEGIYFIKLNSGSQYYNCKFVIAKN